MPIETYTRFPSLRPTILVDEVLKNVYRPSGQSAMSPDAPAAQVIRETPRAA